MKKWFGNLRVSQKLTLISIFFVMPDSVMLYLFITGINANIQFARLEKKGSEYQRPLEALLELLPEHAALAARPAPSDGNELTLKEKEIDAAFNALEEVDARIGQELQFTDEGLAKRKREHYRPHLVRDEWRELMAHLATLDPAASAERHAHLITDVRAMITHAGDMSNLILDPDLDSYYLMDATLLALPANQDRLAAVMAHGAGVLERPEITGAERQQLAIYATLLEETDLDRVVGSVQTALNEDPNFYGLSPSLQARVPPALKEYAGATRAFIQLTKEVFTPEKTSVTAAEYLAAGAKARRASFTLWKIADEEVDTLLQRRIEVFQYRRAKSLVVAGCALLAAIGFVTFITRSISGPLRQQAQALQKANDALEDEIAERKRAEEDLRRSEAQLATAQRIANVGSWGWDLTTREMVWSDENYRIHGVEPRAFTPSYESALDFVHPADQAASARALKIALECLEPFSFEQRIIRLDGTERIVHQRGKILLAPDGAPARMVGTAQDITERKRSEDKLEQVHKELLEVSRQAGMAEVATGVLHNVGNVLNSVNVSAMLISERLSRSKVAHLQNVSTLISSHSADLGDFFVSHPRGKMLPGFIRTLSDRLNAEQTELLREVDGLAKNIGHIKDIVSVQQSYAKVSGIVESLLPVGLVDDALQMNATALERHGVKITREYAETSAVCVDKHKVLQILINVIRNAKEATVENGSREKCLTIAVGMEKARVKISISDNGMGIAPENIARIFAHGFTTKPDGHGFGLHTSALAAAEMGGALTAHSAGPGRGATFTLELPVAAAAGRNGARTLAHVS